MDPYGLLKIVSRVLLPFVLVYGLYLIMNGDLSPGGGLQGGVILATSVILLFFINENVDFDIRLVLQIEKILFLFLLFVVLSGWMAPKFMGIVFNKQWLSLRLVLLNALIGVKVALGIGGIIMMYLEEGGA